MMVSIPENPNSRFENYLGKIIGQESAELPPHPLSRGEAYLKYMAKHSSSGKIIHANSDITERGYLIPNLTSQQVIDAYNGVVSGASTLITNADGSIYYTVNQVDSINDEINIQILYFSHMIVTYSEENGIVTIASKVLTSDIPSGDEVSY